MHKFLRSLALLAVAAPLLAHAGVDEQRVLFGDAYRQLNEGAAVDLATLSARLGDYPLLPYLEYAYLRRNLRQAPPERVARFLAAQPDLPVSDGLRASYLRQLGKQLDWARYLAFYVPSSDPELQCYRLRAVDAQARASESWRAAARRAWLAEREVSEACAPVVQALFDAGLLTADDAWERAQALIESGAARAAQRLRPRLAPPQQRWLDQWLEIHRQPERLRQPSFELADDTAGRIVAHGLRRLARTDPEQALALLRTLERPGLWSATQRAGLERDIVLQAAYSQDPAALARLDELPAAAVDDEVRLWQARLALRLQDWQRLLSAIAALPAAQRDDAQWRYWRGHALQAAGDAEAAQQVLAPLAGERNYYGFLAADRLRLAYSMEQEPARFAEGELAPIAADSGVRRAREFYLLGLGSEARREWLAAMGRLDAAQKQRAALLALEWGWYERAIATANSAGLHDALNLRFPMPYRERVEFYSRKQALDPQVTYAILRKESAFRADAVSAAGAMGLMQVMPETGRKVAQRLKLGLQSRSALLEVDTNLNLGSAYLRAMLDRYGGNLVLAAAAYNAGPSRVGDWLARNAELPPAIWIEAITYPETRNYVKSILAFATVFEWRLHGKAGRLSDYLLPLHDTVACAESAGVCRKPG